MAQDGKLDQLSEFEVEVECLMQALYLRWGYDFREYSRASLRRRVARYMSDNHILRPCDLQHELVRDKKRCVHFVRGLTVNVTDMFRDPVFYRVIREQVIPELRSHPFIKIWHAGCSTGEEAYSMSILLHEEGLGERAVIYATDINSQVLDQASKGVYHDKMLATARENYRDAGGKSGLDDFISVGYERFLIDPGLKKNIVFTQHDLVTDQVFGEMQMVICRNVLIYFRRELQTKVLTLFHNSLDLGGFLGLGIKESLRSLPNEFRYKAIDESARVFQRID
ncbi:CheR family methyltransferase [Ketobacter sp.]|uniref:CheR family methyltransferase n=1 Tax=Ketobacter sp. TaxID=2083498 RepID=UPI000F230D5A|nr:CheR family methyltransferase [Ketobacter sp.]MEE2732842.1 CheR family methyltransferase [Pseudomonadota bacterium]RLU01555.1 MAG: protein-glutamate O-methyltransferase CheR [Ketobacter sp.]